MSPSPPRPAAPPPICTVFAAEAYPATGGKIMGRQSASTSLLRAFIQATGPHQAAYLLGGAAEGPAFEAVVRALGGQSTELVPPHAIGALARYGSLFFGGPNIENLARLRAAAGMPRGFSIIGITYTLSSLAAMRAPADWLTGEVQPWDAVICISEAARGVVRRLLEEEAERLAARFGARLNVPLPQLPVIPLGVHAADFTPEAETRAQERARLGIAEEDVAVLFHGRVSFHAKAHHWAMMAALGRVAPLMPEGRRLHLIVAGGAAGDLQERAVRDSAAALCPGVVLHRISDPPFGPRQPPHWAAADIFTLMSDNIQESFGLAPVEAMAAGLPVVGTDWDGLKETIRDGVDGFRVPTLFAPPGAAANLGRSYALGALNYDHFIGHTAFLCAVDVARAAEAFAALALDPARRRTMGAAGQARVRRELDWAAIMPRYMELWAELAARRAAAAEPTPPRLPDPTRIFAGFPTGALGADAVLARDPAAPGIGLHAAAALPGAILPAPAAPARLARLEALLAAMGEEGATLRALAATLPEAERGALVTDVLWLLKTGFARRLG